MSMADQQSDMTGWAYQRGPVAPQQQDYATCYVKPHVPGTTGGGYRLWRSTEFVDGEEHRGKQDVYVAVHRLQAVVACYDADTPLPDVLADLAGKDVHHESGMPADNRPGNLSVIDHGRHSSVTQEQRKAWAADAKAAADEPADDERCANCDDETDTQCISPDWSGAVCPACAQRLSDGAIIEVL